MASTDDRCAKEEIQESNGAETRVSIPLDISASRKTLLSIEKPPPRSFNLLDFASPQARFKRIADQRDEVSRSVPCSNTNSRNFRSRISDVFSRKINWASLLHMSKKWIRNPMNMALFVWIAVVAISGAILFMVMTGMLNRAIPKKSQRDAWFEVNNQILNALFTLMCLYQHPKRIYHLILLCRWKPEDISRLRKIYCKNGTYKPHEWAHMMVVVILLHVNCFAQYSLCGLNLGYRRSERPAIGVAITISVAIGAPAVAGVYSMLSPLGKDYETQTTDEENSIQHVKTPLHQRLKSLERRYSFVSSDQEMVPVSNPEWSGGILDIWDDISLAYLSLFCTSCVFGWNMDRLGFGNTYVHIATFLLFCLAPFFIFNLAAVNIDNEAAREALGFAGMILCVFGLLYGGFWRIQMRKRFNLPGYSFCCGKPAVADCSLWLFCCFCSLAQEVRTGNAYDVVEDKFCKKPEENGDLGLISPLPREDREDGSFKFNSGFVSSPSPSRFQRESLSPEGRASPAKDGALTPPSPRFIKREASSPLETWKE